MTPHDDLWSHVVAWENLLAAARRARRGKRDRGAVRRFDFHLEFMLLRLARDLIDGTYRPGGFRTHQVLRPKPRLISAAPFRDRVVHHALMNILEPMLDRRFHPDSYACRRGKGAHAAVDRLQNWMRRRRFLLQCDIAQFFPSIDHEILKTKLRRVVVDPKVLRLADLIIDHSNEQDDAVAWFPGDDLFTPTTRRRGLPIGNLTSQWFANLYLNDLDHFVTSHLGVGAFIRYCDDFVLLADDRAVLQEAVGQIRSYLARDRLRLHERKLHIRRTVDGATYVGYRVWPTHRLLRKRNVHAMRRRIRWMKRACADGALEWTEVRRRIASWLGHARQADSRRLVRRLCREWAFTFPRVPIDRVHS